MVRGRDDIYPVRLSKVDCSDNRPWASLLDIRVYHPDPRPVAATTVFSTAKVASCCFLYNMEVYVFTSITQQKMIKIPTIF